MNRFTSQLDARARSRGMSLLELMAVVTIVAILGTIAVNTYRGYLLRTNRTDARMALLRVQAAQEKFFLQNNRYADTAELTPAPADGGLGVPSTTPGGHYTITLARPTTTTYTATATAIAGQTKDAAACQVLTIDELGTRTPTGNECWR